MPKIRVLIVDDAVVFRRLVADELAGDPALEVVGTAANGRIALAKMTQVNPEVVILDVEMPEMDGLATLKELRRTYPRLPVIMFSALDRTRGRGDARCPGTRRYGLFHQASERRRGRRLPGRHPGTIDSKDQGSLPPRWAMQRTALCEETSIARSAGHGRLPRPRSPFATRPGPHVLAIGTSTGGPNALAEIFRQLPADFPVPS